MSAQTAPARSTRDVRLKADITLEWTLPAVPAAVDNVELILEMSSALSNLLTEQMSERNRAEHDVNVRVVRGG